MASVIDFRPLAGILKSLKQGAELDNTTRTLLIDYLEWLDAFLSNRRFYHKRHSQRKQILAKLMAERLSPDEIKHINKQVDNNILDALDDVEALPEQEE